MAFVLEVAAQVIIGKLTGQELLVLVIEVLKVLAMFFVTIWEELLELAESLGLVIMQAKCFEAI